MEAGGQSVVDLVDGLDSLLEGVDAHDAQDGREVLGQVELTAGHNTRADSRGPQPITQVPGLEHPVLALAQRGQAPHSLLVIGYDDGTDLRVQRRRQAHAQRGGRIHELASVPPSQQGSATRTPSTFAQHARRPNERCRALPDRGQQKA